MIPAHRTRALRALPGAACALLLAASAPAASPAAPSADAVAHATVASRVIPVPAAVHAGGGAFRLTPDAEIRAASGARAVADYTATLLRPATGYALPVVPATAPAARPASAPGDAIVLALDAADRGLGDEGYRLRTAPRSVRISARTPAGLFHGVQTLRQLLPAAVDRRTPPAQDVADAPSTSSPNAPSEQASVPRDASAAQDARPAHRAVAWTVPDADIRDVPRYAYRGAMLDTARHFLTVAQVERYIDALALYKVNVLHLHLTDDQGWRIAVASWPRLTTYGGASEVGGGTGGWYTRADYQTIVRYAAAHFLTVVPEIDGPGHSNAALASYARLNCGGVAPARYTGTDVGFSSLCVPKDLTYAFLRDVLGEIAALTPGPYLHIGGDEAHSTSAADYATYMARTQPIVTALGKTVIGWHQIDAAHPVPGAIAQFWGTSGDQPQVVAAAKAGTRVIMSPANRSYLDMKYTPSTPLGKHWAGYVEVRTSYDWDPVTYIPGLPASAVLGVESALWTETLKTDPQLDVMAFPRLPGIAEIGWSPAATHDWASYRVRLAAQAPRWQAMGIDFYRSPQVDWPTP